MKNVIAILIALALPCLMLAQTNLNKTYSINGKQDLSFEFQYGDLIIEKHKGSEIEVEGMLYVNGESAVEKFEIDINEQGNEWELNLEANLEDVEKRTTIVMNDGTKVYKIGTNFSWDTVANEEGVDKVYNGIDVDAKFKIKIPENVNLKVKTTYGNIEILDYWDNMEIHSTYGEVDLILEKTLASPKFTASSTYSSVDLTLPQSTNASLKMKTGYGKIYTDMDLETEKKKRSEDCQFGENISATLNKGTGSISLDATYSNIYLRKAGS